ncbi:MAG TPA: deoxyribonuclease IV [Candidatus Acidoferrum sp.]|nr:deoxyribonuclease IV [Candidatus Acidoferrum sp.]
MPSTLPNGRRLGAHLPLGGGMVAAVDRATAIGARALQIFADNPTAWRRRTEPPKELAAFRARLAEADIGPVAIHAAYLVNLASPDDDFRERSIGVLAQDLRVAPSFGARFVNVHVGSHKGTDPAVGIDRIGSGVARVLSEVDAGPDGALLVLENSSGSGGNIGVDVPELADVLEAIAAHGGDPARVALCLDTAHLWGAGHEISDPEVFDRLLDEIDARIGLERLVMFHLNDSKSVLGSKLDRHEHLGAGRIGVTGLQHILTSPRLAHVTYYLETPGMDEGYDAINVARAYAIAAGKRLKRLPAGAMTLRGSRARTAPADDAV